MVLSCIRVWHFYTKKHQGLISFGLLPRKEEKGRRWRGINIKGLLAIWLSSKNSVKFLEEWKKNHTHTHGRLLFKGTTPKVKHLSSEKTKVIQWGWLMEKWMPRSWFPKHDDLPKDFLLKNRRTHVFIKGHWFTVYNWAITENLVSVLSTDLFSSIAIILQWQIGLGLNSKLFPLLPRN